MPTPGHNTANQQALPEKSINEKSGDRSKNSEYILARTFTVWVENAGWRLAPPTIYLPTNASMHTLTHEVVWAFYANRIYWRLFFYKQSPFSLLISMICCLIFSTFFPKTKTYIFINFQSALSTRIVTCFHITLLAILIALTGH